MAELDPREANVYKRAKEQLTDLRRRDYGLRNLLKDAGMEQSLATVENINPSYVYDNIDKLIDRATGAVVPAPDAKEATVAKEMYRQLMDQFKGFKLAFDEELVKKGADRSNITDVIINQTHAPGRFKQPVTVNEAWRRTKLGQVQEQAYALISETGQQAGLIERALKQMQPKPPEQSAGPDTLSFSA